QPVLTPEREPLAATRQFGAAVRGRERPLALVSGQEAPPPGRALERAAGVRRQPEPAERAGEPRPRSAQPPAPRIPVRESTAVKERRAAAQQSPSRVATRRRSPAAIRSPSSVPDGKPLRERASRSQPARSQPAGPAHRSAAPVP